MDQPKERLRVLEFDRILAPGESVVEDVFRFFSGKADIVVFFGGDSISEHRSISVVFLDSSEKFDLARKFKEIFPQGEFSERPEDPDENFRDFFHDDISKKTFYWFLSKKFDYEPKSLSVEKPILVKTD